MAQTFQYTNKYLDTRFNFPRLVRDLKLIYVKRQTRRTLAAFSDKHRSLAPLQVICMTNITVQYLTCSSQIYLYQLMQIANIE